MGSPPAKRQRRAIVLGSDDEEASTAESQLSTASFNVTTQSLSLKKDTKVGSNQKQPSARAKSSKDPKPQQGRSKNSTIHSFFKNPSQPSSQTTLRPRSPKNDANIPESSEEIEDISSDDDHGSVNSSFDKRRPKLVRTASHLSQANGVLFKTSNSIGAKKKFSISADQFISDAEIEPPVASSSWVDLYPPESLDELVVHKRKVADVHKWLDNVVQGRERKRLLVLKGPSGSGKTATLRLLAKEVGRKLVEWENPVGSSFETDGFVSLATQFEEFLTRITNFQGLELSNEDNEDGSATSIHNSIIMIEDFPNTFSRGSLALMNFRDSILRYLAASTPAPGAPASETQITPVVMIISETHVSSSSNYADSFTVGKILGPQLLQHPSVTVIEFNSVAPTLLSKALTTILRKENKSRTKRWLPSPEALKQISQSGDIRASINSLQLARLFSPPDQKPTKASKSSKKRSASVIPSMPDQSLAFRSNIIDLFHATGKILYNKRTSPSTPIIQPPSHLSHHVRRLESSVSISQLHSDIGTDIETFISCLHENYPPSCYGEDFADSLDDCISTLSDADLLLSSNDGNSSARNSGNSGTNQTEYAFHVSSLGLLFSLPYPVERGKTLSSLLKIGRDPFKMVYPTSLKLWRQIDTNEDIINDWTEVMLKTELAGPMMRLGKREMVRDVLAWIGRCVPGLQMANVDKNRAVPPALDDGEEDGDHTAVPTGSVLALPLPPIAGFGQKISWKQDLNSGSQFGIPNPQGGLVLSDDDIEDD